MEVLATTKESSTLTAKERVILAVRSSAIVTDTVRLDRNNGLGPLTLRLLRWLLLALPLGSRGFEHDDKEAGDDALGRAGQRELLPRDQEMDELVMGGAESYEVISRAAIERFAIDDVMSLKRPFALVLILG